MTHLEVSRTGTGNMSVLFVDFRGGSCGGDDHVVVC